MNHDQNQDPLSRGASGMLRAARLAGHIVYRKVAKALCVKFAALLCPLAAPFLIFFLLFGFIYFSVFMFPRYIAEEAKARVIYYTGEQDPWTLDDDTALYLKYMEINQGWLGQFQSHESLEDERVRHISGNAANPEATAGEIWGDYMKDTPEAGAAVVAEQDQAKPHAMPWSVLGGLDRVLGDPIITGLPEREPNPEYHHEYLEPKLEWRTLDLYYYHTWTVCDDKGDCTTYTKEYRHPVRLLAGADTYEAKFEYTWREKVIEHRSGDSHKKIIVPELVSISKTGPYYARLQDLLADHGLVQKLDTELVLELAVNMDPEFHYEFATLGDYRLDVAPRIYDGPLGPVTWPAAGTVTSGFGYRIHPVFGDRRFHTGIDIAAPEGTPVYAAANGVVVFAGTLGGYGRTIMINHGEYVTLYAHLRSFEARVGRDVLAGDQIGRMGQTGIATGPHLHFEVRAGGTYADPLAWLPGR